MTDLNAVLILIVSSALGVVIVLVLRFLVTASATTFESTGDGVPEKVQAFVDDIVQNIRDIQVTDQLREFWKSVERIFNDWRSETDSPTPKKPPVKPTSASSPIGRNDVPQTRQLTLEREMRCFRCGTSISGGKFCPNCGTEQRTCPICRKGVWYGEKMLECPMCGMVAHAPHLLEWLRVKGTCPNCRKKLVLN